jgi:hypothetical protein
LFIAERENFLYPKVHLQALVLSMFSRLAKKPGETVKTPFEGVHSRTPGDLKVHVLGR